MASLFKKFLLLKKSKLEKSLRKNDFSSLALLVGYFMLTIYLSNFDNFLKEIESNDKSFYKKIPDVYIEEYKQYLASIINSKRIENYTISRILIPNDLKNVLT